MGEIVTPINQNSEEEIKLFDKLVNSNVVIPIEDEKNESKAIASSVQIPINRVNKVDIPTDADLTNADISYSVSYNETKNSLKDTVGQIDMLSVPLQSEIERLMNSNYRNKYTSIATLAGAVSNLISTKVTALREINKVITDSHTLDMRRYKDIAMAQGRETGVNDDQAIIDMYQAMISNANHMHTLNNISSAINRVNMDPGNVSYNPAPSSMQNWMPATVEEKAFATMMYEGNPNIKVVVVYDRDTGTKFFNAIDVTTGGQVQNYDLPDPMFLEDITIDEQNMIAKNKNLNIIYDLILTGGSINNY